MATRIRYVLVDGTLTLPDTYGNTVLGPGQSAIIADTVANVSTVMGSTPGIELLSVPDGQTGAITPSTPGPTAAAQAAASATLAAASVSAAAASATSAAGSAAYTPAVSGDWSGNPTTIQNAIDRIALKIFGGSPTGKIG